MKKAERIFQDTYRECRMHAKRHGFEYNQNGKPAGYGFVVAEEAVSIRTLNDMQKYIDSERENIAVDEELGILEPDRLNILKYAIDMVQVTLDNTRARI